MEPFHFSVSDDEFETTREQKRKYRKKFDKSKSTNSRLSMNFHNKMRSFIEVLFENELPVQRESLADTEVGELQPAELIENPCFIDQTRSVSVHCASPVAHQLIDCSSLPKAGSKSSDASTQTSLCNCSATIGQLTDNLSQQFVAMSHLEQLVIDYKRLIAGVNLAASSISVGESQGEIPAPRKTTTSRPTDERVPVASSSCPVESEPVLHYLSGKVPFIPQDSFRCEDIEYDFSMQPHQPSRNMLSSTLASELQSETFFFGMSVSPVKSISEGLVEEKDERRRTSKRVSACNEFDTECCTDEFHTPMSSEGRAAFIAGDSTTIKGSGEGCDETIRLSFNEVHPKESAPRESRDRQRTSPAKVAILQSSRQPIANEQDEDPSGKSVNSVPVQPVKAQASVTVSVHDLVDHDDEFFPTGDAFKAVRVVCDTNRGSNTKQKPERKILGDINSNIGRTRPTKLIVNCAED